jgi:hypothetical protein
VEQGTPTEYTAQPEQERVFGRVHTTTQVYYDSYAVHDIATWSFASGGLVDMDQVNPVPLYQGAVVEIIGPSENGRTYVLVTSEGGPDVHNGWHGWQLWIDDGTFDVER